MIHGLRDVYVKALDSDLLEKHTLVKGNDEYTND